MCRASSGVAQLPDQPWRPWRPSTDGRLMGLPAMQSTTRVELSLFAIIMGVVLSCGPFFGRYTVLGTPKRNDCFEQPNLPPNLNPLLPISI